MKPIKLVRHKKAKSLTDFGTQAKNTYCIDAKKVMIRRLAFASNLLITIPHLLYISLSSYLAYRIL